MIQPKVEISDFDNVMIVGFLIKCVNMRNCFQFHTINDLAADHRGI